MYYFLVGWTSVNIETGKNKIRLIFISTQSSMIMDSHHLEGKKMLDTHDKRETNILGEVK